MMQYLFNIFVSIVLLALITIQGIDYTKNSIKEYKIVHTITEAPVNFLAKSPKEGLLEALHYYNVKYPEIVYAQAILETANFTSNLCVKDNNLFGLYNSKNKEFYQFGHWVNSIIAYIEYIQYKYNPQENYYDFLLRIGYAEDPEYINKVKNIVNNIDNYD